LAEETVLHEPVFAKFPAQAPIYSEFWRVRLIFEEPAALLRTDSKAYQQIPHFTA